MKMFPCALTRRQASVVLVFGLVAGCVTNEAGRRQLLLVSSGEEMELGLSSALL